MHATSLKETYDSMELILRLVNYSSYKWKICGNVKVIALPLGLQLGYTKHQCFLCHWNSQDDEQHYVQKNWPTRERFIPGRYNVHHFPLVDPAKNIFTTNAHQVRLVQELC